MAQLILMRFLHSNQTSKTSSLISTDNDNGKTFAWCIRYMNVVYLSFFKCLKITVYMAVYMKLMCNLSGQSLKHPTCDMFEVDCINPLVTLLST